MHELLNRLSFLAPFFYALLGATILAIFATAYLRRKRCRSAALGASESLDDKKTRRSFFSNARNFSFVRAFCWIIGVGIALMIGAAGVFYLHGPTDPCSYVIPTRRPSASITLSTMQDHVELVRALRRSRDVRQVPRQAPKLYNRQRHDVHAQMRLLRPVGVRTLRSAE